MTAPMGCTVLDGAGRLLGRLDGLYLDTNTGDISFAGVALARWGRRRSVLAPLAGSVVTDSVLRLRCGGQLVRAAPDAAHGRGLTVEMECQLFAHYDLPWVPARTASRRLIRTLRR